MPKQIEEVLRRVADHCREKANFPLGQNVRKAVLEAVESLPGADDGDLGELREVALDLAPIVAIQEAAVSDSGEIRIKVIAPGQGSSGYYPAEMIQRDGPKVATTGLQMFWDHPTATEAAERPERSLNDLAAVFTSDATFDAEGPAGAGLYATAKVYEQFRKPLNEIAGDIGVSIRGQGRLVEREIDGEVRQVVEELTALDSVDFVTRPGAGGRIVSIFEAARSGRTKPAGPPAAEPTQQQEVPPMDEKALKEAQDKVSGLEAKLAEAQKREAQQAARLNRIEAREIVSEALRGVEGLPESEAGKIRDKVSANPPLTEAGDVDAEKVREATKAAVNEVFAIAESFGARVKVSESGGQPAGEPESIEDVKKRLAESLRRRSNGQISEDTAKRVWGVA